MSNPVAQACSFLFVPATHPERFQKALASGADMVIADWEDAVAPADKAGARAALLQAAAAMDAAQRARLLVRINAEGTPWFADDLQALATLAAQGYAGAVVPKAESAATLQAVAQAAGARGALLPLVESVAGLHAVDTLATAPQVARLAFGHLDFQVDAGMACGADEAELLALQAELVEMQEWVKATGARIVVVFEGRDRSGSLPPGDSTILTVVSDLVIIAKLPGSVRHRQQESRHGESNNNGGEDHSLSQRIRHVGGFRTPHNRWFAGATPRNEEEDIDAITKCGQAQDDAGK